MSPVEPRHRILDIDRLAAKSTLAYFEMSGYVLARLIEEFCAECSADQNHASVADLANWSQTRISVQQRVLLEREARLPGEAGQAENLAPGGR